MAATRVLNLEHFAVVIVADHKQHGAEARPSWLICLAMRRCVKHDRKTFDRGEANEIGSDQTK
jgi:hypothetical protein